MRADETTIERVAALFGTHLDLELPSREEDLQESGLLDSLVLVELLVLLEREFAMRITIEDLELDHFRSVNTIADFVAAHSNGNGNGNRAAGRGPAGG